MKNSGFLGLICGIFFSMFLVLSSASAQSSRIEIMDSGFWSWVNNIKTSWNPKENFGVTVNTKCVNGVCNTSKKYLNKAEAEARNIKMKNDMNKVRLEMDARFKAQKELMDKIFAERFKF